MPIPSLPSHTLKTDVLVIGGGAAGVRAALSAAGFGASVLLVSSEPPARGGTSFQNLSRGWGIQALVGDERTDGAMEAFSREILEAGLGRADPSLVRVLVEESGPRLEDLLHMGVRFRTIGSGEPIRARGCFSTMPRAFLTEDLENVRRAFSSAIRRSSVKTLTGEALQLLVFKGGCWGAWVLAKNGEILRVTAPATILATGGGAGIFGHRMVPRFRVGTGYALALKAGATLRNMAFIQFMLVLHGKAGPAFLPLSDLGRVGVLRTEDGGDLLEDGIPDASIRAAAVAARQTHYPFSTRDASLLVDSAVVRERARGKVFWHAPEGGGPPLSVGHAAHAFNGGVRIDDRAESSVPGLFAAGETAAGPHGADRIGGCMMTATQVFGHRAGRFAAERARACRSVPDPLPGPALMEQRRPGPSGTYDTRDTQTLESRARSLIQASLGVLRNENVLKVCLSDLRELREEAGGIPWQSPADLRSLYRLRCLLSVGEAVARAALEQKSSLGGHMRTDDPRGDRL